MPIDDVVKEFWEKKILDWEEARYARPLNPLSWTVRGRLKQAARVILERMPPQSAVLELGCGSGHLAARLAGHCGNYIGIDIAENAIARAAERKLPGQFRFETGDVNTMPLPWADLTVFLGLSDWLEPGQLSDLLQRLRSPQVLFSYTEAARWNPYRAYRFWADPAGADHRRARTYDSARIEAMLSAADFTMEVLVRPAAYNPGGLVWARKI